MNAATNPDVSSSTHSQLPRDGVRTTVTLLLLFHFFALLMAVLGTDAGNPPGNSPSSPLLVAMHRTPGVAQYLQLLNLDHTYRFHLTNAEELDMDFRFQMDVYGQDGQQQQVMLPEAGLRGLRFRRYERLAWKVAQQAMIAEFTGDDLHESVVPRAIARGILQEHNAQRVELRVQGRVMEEMDRRSAEELQGDNVYRKLYEASAKQVKDELILVKQVSRRDSSPAAQQPDSKTPANQK